MFQATVAAEALVILGGTPSASHKRLGRLPSRECSLIAIAVNDFSPPLSDDGTLVSSQFIGVRFVVHMFGEVLPQARPVLLEAAQSQMLVQAAQLYFGISDQILVAQFVEA